MGHFISGSSIFGDTEQDTQESKDGEGHNDAAEEGDLLDEYLVPLSTGWRLGDGEFKHECFSEVSPRIDNLE